ncbi:UNKNOWN [Stylonychia lemnae]|uniref:Uncharacterized protein n=1 Tax=Stylonychia lemnae TaxID=5949 RepID=A0A078ADD9_STYLE|nr:UNKNOWN [Stylonychia lemnae]|eukprot:CDW79547.1 UNKNOWN [Stylonychia lemnae]
MCLIRQEGNKFTFVFSDVLNGITIGRLIKKGEYSYQFIQDNKRLVNRGQVSSIILVRLDIIAYSEKDHLKIFDIKRKKLIKSIICPNYPHLFKIQDYNYKQNPFAFVKSNNSISLFNLRNYQLTKVIDSKYCYISKMCSLINIRIGNSDQKYRLIEIQRYDCQAEIREIIVKII